ncbi:MAG: hypothetical protein BWY25_02102 [Chloroflexi bacterium ADurb.Bin222]|nr:MAG: hypothetical protein BWY25_02102 [Chloroflexi bacterium ADurb.Bin222]
MFLQHTTENANNVGTWERGHLSTWACVYFRGGKYVREAEVPSAG